MSGDIELNPDPRAIICKESSNFYFTSDYLHNFNLLKIILKIKLVLYNKKTGLHQK